MSEATVAAPASLGVPSAVITLNRPAKRPFKAQHQDHGRGGSRRSKHSRTKRDRNTTVGSTEEILRADVHALIKSRRAASAQTTGDDAAPVDEANLPELMIELDLEVLELSSTGDGLAVVPSDSSSEQIYIVPFTVPGDKVRAKLIRHVWGEGYSHTDFLSVLTPSPLRDDTRVRCAYFARCGGCQLQMVDYAEQLRHKKRVLTKAFANFANLPAELVPEVHDTIGSPLQYGYRTKLTPHFDGPPGWRRRSKKGTETKPAFTSCPEIGFSSRSLHKVLDIEDCPIGTEAVRLGNTRERLRMQQEYTKYKRGATLLLRESTTRHPKDNEATAAELAPYTVKSESGDFVDIKSCVSDHKATSTEYIGNYVFENSAGFFFQNNSSILPAFTSYIRDHILPRNNTADPDTTTTTTTTTTTKPPPPIKYLIDAYSGCGLFTITLSSVFQHSTGVDIAGESINYARKNAALNGLGDDRCRFIAADATELFKSITYPADETVVILDPPRKGCDASFLTQLRAFGPRRVLYVSCNVHTQARDVGVLVRGYEGGSHPGPRYEIESLIGFDFFPQTSHVEGVVILNRVQE